MAVSGTVRVNVLGAFQLLVDDQEVDVGRAQVREVIACLTASPGEVTSRGELIDALWGESAPKDPKAALRVVLTRTREALGSGADRLATSSAGTVLEVDTDIDEFRRSVKMATEADDQIDALEAALAVWRGDAYQNLGASDWMRRARKRLSDERSQVTGQLAGHLVAAERYEDALAVLRPLYSNAPEREDLAVLMATALAPLGRKVEAIELLDATRASLREQGLDPSDGFVQAETDILRGAVDLRNESHARPDGTTFVGRTSEVEQILGRPRPSTTVIVGDAGIGKTSLLNRIEASLTDAGGNVISVQAPTSPMRPMETIGLIAEALLERGAAPSRSQESALSLLLPGSVLFAASRPSTRELLVSAAVDFIASSCGPAPTVFIDDSHLMDSGSEVAVQQLAASGVCRIVLGRRPNQSSGAWEADLSDVVYFELGPLSEGESIALVRREIPRSSDGEIAELYRRSGGSPLFLRLLIDLAANGVAHDESLPPAVLATIQQRLSVLSRDARRLLSVAAVFGTSVSVNYLGHFTDDTDRGLIEAEKSRLVTLNEDRSSATFAHALVAEGAYQLLPEAERVLLHDEIGRFLESVGEPPIVYWPHCREAEPLDPSRAIAAAGEVAAQFAEALAWENAIGCANWAIAKAAELYPEDPTPYDPLITLASAEVALGVAGSQDRLIEGATLAADAGDHERSASAVIELCNSGSAALTGLDVEVVVDLISRSLEHDLKEPTRLRLWAAAPRALVYSSEGLFGQRLYARAVEAFESAKKDTQELILRNSEAGFSNPKDFPRLQQATARMSEAAGTNPELQWMALWFRFRDALIVGDGIQLSAVLDEIRNSSSYEERRHAFVALGQSFDVQMQQAWAEAAYAHVHERYEEAEEAANRALEVGLEQLASRGDGFGSGWVTSSYGTLIVAIRHAQGRLAELVDFVETEAPAIPAWRVAIVMSNYAAGNYERVIQELEPLVADDFAYLVPDPAWTAAMTLLSEPISELMERPIVDQTYHKLLPFADRMSFSGLCTFGPIAASLALLADALDLPAAAREHREAAADLWSSVRSTQRLE